jgi:hypothetical protein
MFTILSQKETSTQFHLTLVRMIIMKKMNKNNAGEYLGKMNPHTMLA